MVEIVLRRRSTLGQRQAADVHPASQHLADLSDTQVLMANERLPDGLA